MHSQCAPSFYYRFFVTSFKYSANSSFKSSLESAKSTVACKNPCLLPISYLLPSKSYAYISSFFASITSASVSCISPPAPLGVFSRQSNIAGVITYLPSTATSDGASSFSAFRPFLSAYTFCLQHYRSPQYRTLKLDPFRPLHSKHCRIIFVKLFDKLTQTRLFRHNHIIAEHYRKGSFPTKLFAQSTACPRPFCSF